VVLDWLAFSLLLMLTLPRLRRRLCI
jgi:hypothetical protein